MADNPGFTNSVFPIEILQEIFKYLNFLDLKACTEVCTTWKLAGSTLYSESKAKNQCEKLFKSSCQDVYNRTKLSWTELFTSLELWANIRTATVSRVVSIPAVDAEFMKNAYCDYYVQYLKNAIISYPTSKKGGINPISGVNTITYFDTETSKVIDETTFEFTFVDYEENQDLIVFRENDHTLRIVTKINMKSYILPKKIHIQNWQYKFFFFKEVNKIFYVNTEGWIVMAYCVKEHGIPKILTQDIVLHQGCLYNDEISAISYKELFGKETLKFLTKSGAVYTIKDGDYDLTCVIEKDDKVENVLDSLRDHGFEWNRCINSWFLETEFEYDRFFMALLQDDHHYLVQPYSNLLFVGVDFNECPDCSACHVHVYNKPFQEEEFDFSTKKASCLIDLKRLFPSDFTEEWDRFSSYMFTSIGVIEIKDGHRLIVEYGGITKIFIIDIKHNLCGDSLGSNESETAHDPRLLHSQHKYCGKHKACDHYY